MLILTAHCFYVIYCLEDNTSFLKKLLTIVSMILVCLFITIYMVYNPDNPNFFFTTFILLTFITIKLQLRYGFHSEKYNETSNKRKIYSLIPICLVYFSNLIFLVFNWND